MTNKYDIMYTCNLKEMLNFLSKCYRSKLLILPLKILNLDFGKY